MIQAAEVEVVLLDATVPHRFCEAQLLPDFIAYLKHNAWITPEVEGELQQSARSRRWAGLRVLEHAAWPRVTDQLPPDLRHEFEDYRRAAQQPSEPNHKHIGEIATVLMAWHLGADLVITDDGFGKTLAKIKKVPSLNSPRLTYEMVGRGHLTEAEGYRVFSCSTRTGTQADYLRRLREWRETASV